MKSLSMKLTDEQLERMVDNYLRCKGSALPVTEEQIARFEKKLDKETPQENLLMNAEALLRRGYVSHDELVNRHYPQKAAKTISINQSSGNHFFLNPSYQYAPGMIARKGMDVSSDTMDKILKHLERLRGLNENRESANTE
jgi:hypothetical protein